MAAPHTLHEKGLQLYQVPLSAEHEQISKSDRLNKGNLNPDGAERFRPYRV